MDVRHFLYMKVGRFKRQGVDLLMSDVRIADLDEHKNNYTDRIFFKKAAINFNLMAAF